MNMTKYLKEVEKINKKHPDMEDRRNAIALLNIKEFEGGWNKALRPTFKQIFWQVIENTHDLILFIVLLPFAPIVYIIKAIREK